MRRMAQRALHVVLSSVEPGGHKGHHRMPHGQLQRRRRATLDAGAHVV